jgi:phage baseplate assembly protein W
MPHTWTIAPSAPTPVTGTVDQVRRQLFGTDIMFTTRLQLGNHGDYLTWEQEESVRQAIYRRLMTAPGEYAVRPEYGVGVRLYVKRRMGRAQVDELRQRIIDQLARETRIEKIVEVNVVQGTFSGAPGLQIYVKCKLLGQERTFGYSVKENS